jgi:transcriptional regulator with XRE-family HTH domain
MSNRSTARLKLRIAEICDALGINQTQLAARIGCKPNTISQYVNGSRYPGKDALVQLCDALDCTPSDIFLFRSKSESCNNFHET